jgi:hypothetical protein
MLLHSIVPWHRKKRNQRNIAVMTQIEKKRALSVPENTGRRGLYKTLRVRGI